MAKEPQIAKIAIKPAFQALFGHPRRGQRSTYAKKGLHSAGFLWEWLPDCRTEGFKTAKHYKNRGLGALAMPTTKNGRFLVSKMALKLAKGALIAKSRPPNAGFKQKRAKNGLLSARFSRRRPSRCRTEGGPSAKRYKNRGPEAPQIFEGLGRRPLRQMFWLV